MKQKLYLFTERFPYEGTETGFLSTELDVLMQYYEVMVISHSSGEWKAAAHEEDRNCGYRHVNIFYKLNLGDIIYYAIRYFLDKDGWKEISDILKSRKGICRKIYQSVGFYIRAMKHWHCLKKKKVLEPGEPFICYSYWYTDYLYSITRNREKFTGIKIICRTHNFDLYDDRYLCGRQPFKPIMDAKLDRLIFVCEYGRDYYLKRYGYDDSKKYIVSKIGTAPPRKETQKQKKDAFVLLSCSRVVPLKRIELIIDALSIWIGEKIEWHHIGGGSYYGAVCDYAREKLSDNANVRYLFHGNMEHHKILEFYAETEVNCFITTSEIEGSPVSIQEALAYGVPVIGTAVGAISEMIQDNGVLLPANPSPEDICDALKKIVTLNEADYMKMRQCSRELWEKEYQAEKNARYMLEVLGGM